MRIVLDLLLVVVLAVLGCMAWGLVGLMGSVTLAGIAQCPRFYSLPFAGCEANSGHWLGMLDMGVWAAAFVIIGLFVVRRQARGTKR